MFGEINNVFWLIKIVLLKEREESVSSCFKNVPV